MPKGVRKSITVPGLLAPTVKERCREFGHFIFTPYAVELVCYDLRSDAKHSITLEIARDTQPAQDAVDRELVARYRPGQPRKGLLVQLVDRIHRLQSIAAASRHDLPLPPLRRRGGAHHVPFRNLETCGRPLEGVGLSLALCLHHRADSLRPAR